MFQAAQDERFAIGLGEALDLLVHGGLNLLRGCTASGIDRAQRARLLLVLAPPRGGPSCIGGHAIRDSVKPASQGLFLADGGGLPCQDQECRLKGVIGVMHVSEPAPADPQDHRPVPPHQHLEGGLVVPGQEDAEQLSVGLLLGSTSGQVPDVPEDCP